MKKIFLLLAVVAGLTFSSCEGDQGPQGEPGGVVVSDVYQVSNVNFLNDGTGYYGIVYQIPQIFEGDMVLVYRNIGVSNGDPIWESLPKTYFFTDGEELDYNFDFTRNDVSIYLGYTSNSVLTPDFLQNQTFRVMVVPGDVVNSLTTKNYDEVATALNVTDADFQNSKLQTVVK